MKDIVSFLGPVVFISSCGQRDVLVENQWIIIDGTYKNGVINFQSTQAVLLADSEGHEIKSLDFLMLVQISSKFISEASYHL